VEQPEIHNLFLQACKALSDARIHFKRLVERNALLGNDNHIGDIGEYWVKRYFDLCRPGSGAVYPEIKNALYDLELGNGTKISVKTITRWSKTKMGTQLKPLDGVNWTILAAVYLNESLIPEKIAIVNLDDLMQQEVFRKNHASRNPENREEATFSYPRFTWWPWLEKWKITETDLATVCSTTGVSR
jgi:hypothetical protein